MNIKKIALSLAVLAVAVSPMVAMALPPEPGEATVDLSSAVTVIMTNVWMVFAAIAVILFVYAGVKFLIAGGDPSKVAEARQAAIWGVIGVAVMILAYSVFKIAGTLIGAE